MRLGLTEPAVTHQETAAQMVLPICQQQHSSQGGASADGLGASEMTQVYDEIITRMQLQVHQRR